jgi:hypothetical protein
MFKTINYTSLLVVVNMINLKYSGLMNPVLPIGGGTVIPPLTQEDLLPEVDNEVYIMPANGVFTSGYGLRWGRMHNGILGVTVILLS